METEKKDPVFVDGMMFKKPHENAPDFVKGAISMKVDELIAFLQKHNNNGWVNIDMKKSQKGPLYFQLNDWKPENKEGTVPVNAGEDNRQAPEIKEEDLPW